MSRWQNWVESQCRTVEADGVAAATIRLESSDGTAWGTWSVKTESLEEVIENTIELLAEDLPKERHACRLVSYDSKGEQLSIMPHAVMGRSAEASKISNRDRSHAQATAVHLANAEQVLGIQSRQLDKFKTVEAEIFEDNLILRQKLIELMNATSLTRVNEKIAEERLQVFKELVATSKPLLEAVIAMGAEFATFKFSEIVEGLKRKQLAEESLTTENQRLKEELAALAKKVADAEAHRESADSAVPDGAQRTRKTQTNGGTSRQGNHRRRAGNSGKPIAATPSGRAGG